jgi:predicted PurR-regulated permease PerM
MKISSLIKAILLFLLFFFPSYTISAQEVAFTQEDREGLIKVGVKLEEIEKRIEQRFEEIDKRFEQVDKRLEELRMDMNKRFDQITTFMWIIASVFGGIVAVTIGFAILDRRIMMRPF